jgi:hypothetical protein
MLWSRLISGLRFPGSHPKAFVNAQDCRLRNLKVKNPQRLPSICCSGAQFSTVPPASSIGYHWINGVERLELYRPGGYHPVLIDDLLHDRYRIVEKLGFGGYSTIWLARDEVDKRYVAVKIGISSPSLPRRELQILRALHGSASTSQKPESMTSPSLPTSQPTRWSLFTSGKKLKTLPWLTRRD